MAATLFPNTDEPTSLTLISHLLPLLHLATTMSSSKPTFLSFLGLGPGPPASPTLPGPFQVFTWPSVSMDPSEATNRKWCSLRSF